MFDRRKVQRGWGTAICFHAPQLENHSEEDGESAYGPIGVVHVELEVDADSDVPALEQTCWNAATWAEVNAVLAVWIAADALSH